MCGLRGVSPIIFLKKKTCLIGGSKVYRLRLGRSIIIEESGIESSILCKSRIGHLDRKSESTIDYYKKNPSA